MGISPGIEHLDRLNGVSIPAGLSSLAAGVEHGSEM